MSSRSRAVCASKGFKVINRVKLESHFETLLIYKNASCAGCFYTELVRLSCYTCLCTHNTKHGNFFRILHVHKVIISLRDDDDNDEYGEEGVAVAAEREKS